LLLTSSTMSTNRKSKSDDKHPFDGYSEHLLATMKPADYEHEFATLPPEFARYVAAQAERMGISGGQYIRTLVAEDGVLNAENHPLS
jgi:hypothetical protein